MRGRVRGAKRWCLLAVATLGLSRPLRAHVGPADLVNNRYYKLAPMAERVRVVYTIFYGEEPGRRQRAAIDRDGDGLLSEIELRAFAKPLEARLHAAVSFELNGTTAPMWWEPLDIGFPSGAADARGGAFAVDLVGTICTGAKAGTQELLFRERLILEDAGETELFVDPAPGIAIDTSVLAGREARLRGERWQGGAGPLEAGYTLAFHVEGEPGPAIDTRCVELLAGAAPSRSRSWLFALAAAGVAAVLLGYWLRTRSRRD